MATSREIMNDLRAQAQRLAGTGNDHLVRSLKRGATEIERALSTVASLEAAAQAEADQYQRYVNGDGT